MTNDSSTLSAQARRQRWWGLIALLSLGVIALAMVWWWWQAQLSPRATPTDTAQQEAKLAALLSREQSLTTELNKVDAAQKQYCPPGYVLDKAPSAAAASGSSDPDAVASRDASGDAKLPPLSQKALVDKLERATALVLLPNSKGLAIGTGFFVSPHHLITNRHVVESSSDGRVLLASRSLERIRRGTVLAVTDNSNPGSPDFALVRLDTGVAPGLLEINTGATKLSDVVAAGYPGLVMQGDASFMRLVRDGDLSAAPDLSLTRGTIQSMQDSFAGTPIIVHTASILQGNSGGPLVDACGRVVGVNTFIAVDKQQSGRVSYAIQAHVMGTFAQVKGVPVNRDTRPCG